MFQSHQHEVLEKTIENTPTTPWIVAAALSIPLSIALYSSGRKLAGLLVGLWTPTLLNASIYNRLLKSA